MKYLILVFNLFLTFIIVKGSDPYNGVCEKDNIVYFEGDQIIENDILIECTKSSNGQFFFTEVETGSSSGDVDQPTNCPVPECKEPYTAVYLANGCEVCRVVKY